MKSVLIALLSIFIFCVASVACAEDVPSHADEEKDPHHIGFISSVNLGVRYSSVLENRGVVLYRDFQIDPVVGVFFFNDRVEFLGDSLGFRDFVARDWLRVRTRFVSITDQPLFPTYDSVKSGATHRPDTYEWSSSLEFFLPGYNSHYKSEIDLTFAKDISAHHGNYLELQGKVKLTDFRVPIAQVKIEPNLFGLIGYGDDSHNRYFYGPSADSGFNNMAYGLWFAFPEEADRYYPIIQIRHFQTLGQNAKAEYATGRGEGWLFSFIATTGVL